ncbi:DUF975 family protein [Enterococcus sp. LJL98]
MKSNAELKQEAKEMLAGRWKDAVLMNLVPAAIAIILVILFMIIAVPAVMFLNSNTSTIDASANFNPGSSSGSSFFGGIIGAFFTAGITWTFLDILRNPSLKIEPFKDIFLGFKSPYAGGIVIIYLLSSIFTFLWALLFIIPGIIKQYAYSQAYYVYYDAYENTGVAPSYLDAITESRRLMDGFKGQLFILDLSFIGWHILCLFTLGIGYLWLTPYIHATKAAFYKQLAEISYR